MGTVLGHGALLANLLNEKRSQPSTRKARVDSDAFKAKLWKCVENAEARLSLCSGCAGDYEDPERSAWEECGEADEEEARRREVAGIEWWVDEAGES